MNNEQAVLLYNICSKVVFGAILVVGWAIYGSTLCAVLGIFGLFFFSATISYK